MVFRQDGGVGSIDGSDVAFCCNPLSPVLVHSVRECKGISWPCVTQISSSPVCVLPL